MTTAMYSPGVMILEPLGSRLRSSTTLCDKDVVQSLPDSEGIIHLIVLIPSIPRIVVFVDTPCMRPPLQIRKIAHSNPRRPQIVFGRRMTRACFTISKISNPGIDDLAARRSLKIVPAAQ